MILLLEKLFVTSNTPKSSTLISASKWTSLESNLVMRGGGIGIMILVILLVLIAYLFYKYNLLDVYKEVMKAKGSPIKMALLATKFLSGKLFKPKN